MNTINEIWGQKIDAWIEAHREEMIEDIIHMVRIRSVSDPGSDDLPFGKGCHQALHAMLDMGKDAGFSVKNYDDRMGSINMGRTGPTIGLWGHLDVVPEGTGWIYPPYEGIVHDGLIIGRGAQDNKGQAVAALYVMRCIRDLEIPLQKNLSLYLGTDEEAGMRDIDYLLEQETEPMFSIVPDSSYPVCYGEKGIVSAWIRAKKPFTNDILEIHGGVAGNVVPDQAYICLRKTAYITRAIKRLDQEVIAQEEAESWKITAGGVSAHAAFPQGGINAIGVLTGALLEANILQEQDQSIIRFINAVSSECYGNALEIACEDEISGRLTCCSAQLSMENGCAMLHLNIRCPVHMETQWMLGQAGAACEKNSWEFLPDRVSPSHYFPVEHPVVKILTQTYNEITHDNKAPFVLSGGTYARRLKRAISFGMGFGSDMWKYKNVRQQFPQGHGDAHSPDEFAVIDHLLISIKIYVLGLLAIDGINEF